MIEVGETYKLKKIDLPMIQNDTSDYEVLAIRDGMATCLNTETNEIYLFNLDVIIDPENPEDDTFKDISVIEALNNVSNTGYQLLKEDGGCAGGSCGVASCSTGCGCSNVSAAISTGQSIGSSSTNLGTSPVGPIGHIYGAMVNGKPVEGKSVKKKKKKKNEAYLNGTNHIKLEFDEDQALVYILIDNEDCYTVDIDRFLQNVSEYIYNEIDNDVFEFDVNWFDHFGKLNRYLKKVNSKENELPVNEELAEAIYVSPQELLDEIKDTFDPNEELVTIVENNREKLRITVKYTDPNEGLLTHTIIKEWLDEADYVIDDEEINELSIEDCVHELCMIFSEFGYETDAQIAIRNQLDRLLSESYENEDDQKELFDRALELRDTFYNSNEMNERTEAMIDYLDLLESIERNQLLIDFVDYAKNKNIEELSLDLLESTDDDYVISDTIAKRLERLGFIFADTKECVYKREGNYKHLIKYDKEKNIIKYKVFKDDKAIDEKVFNLEDKSDVNKIFDEISQLVEERE